MEGSGTHVDFTKDEGNDPLIKFRPRPFQIGPYHPQCRLRLCDAHAGLQPPDQLQRSAATVLKDFVISAVQGGHDSKRQPEIR
jgi:hypothetical protein